MGGAVQVYLVGCHEKEWSGDSREHTYSKTYKNKAEAQADVDARNKQESDYGDVWEMEERVGIPFESDPDRVVILKKGSCFVL